MSQHINILLMVLFLIAAFFLATLFAGLRVKKACDFIIRDLSEQKAFDPDSAVALPYCTKTAFNFGLRDYRPGALKQLITQDIVRLLPDGRFYLREGQQPSGRRDITSA